jgi:hypothetical protein
LSKVFRASLSSQMSRRSFHHSAGLLPPLLGALKHPGHVLWAHAQPLGQLSADQPLLMQFQCPVSFGGCLFIWTPDHHALASCGSVEIALLCGNLIVLSDLGLVMQNGVQQRLVNSYFAVVFDEAHVVIDEAQFAEFVHE